MQDWRRQTDIGHIKLLAIFHVVVGCLALAGLGFVALHYMMMSTMLPMMERDMAKQHPPGLPPPAEFMQIFVWMYIFFAVILIIAGVLNLLSAYFMSRRKHLVFSLVVAGLNCLQVPLGTVLGVFTIIVLMRDSVRAMYAEAERGAGGAGMPRESDWQGGGPRF